MNTDHDKQPKEAPKPGTAAPFIAAVRKGAALQIKRMKVLAELIRQSEEQSRQEAVNKSLTE